MIENDKTTIAVSVYIARARGISLEDFLGGMASEISPAYSQLAIAPQVMRSRICHGPPLHAYRRTTIASIEVQAREDKHIAEALHKQYSPLVHASPERNTQSRTSPAYFTQQPELNLRVRRPYRLRDGQRLECHQLQRELVDLTCRRSLPSEEDELRRSRFAPALGRQATSRAQVTLAPDVTRVARS
jgi:hypothetical protein